MIRPNYTIQPDVYIIESAELDDYLDDRKEGVILEKSLKMMGVKNFYFPIFTLESFNFILSLIQPPYIDPKDETIIKVPVLHISTHGNNEGIQFMDGRFLNWKDFGSLLLPINKKCMQYLGVCMSVCCGAYAEDAAKVLSISNCPYLYLVGPIKTIGWADALLAFQVFYKHIDKLFNSKFLELNNLINSIVGNEVFKIIIGPETQKAFEEKYKRQFLEKIKEYVKK